MHNRRNGFLVAVAVRSLIFLGSLAARAQGDELPPEVPPSQPAGEPASGVEKVVVGAYVNQVHEFSLRDNSFTVDFYLWFRWKNPELKPYETFSVVDGRIESKTDAVVKDLPSGEKHAYTRVVAKITRFFDTRAYPLDNHQLAVVVEEEDSEAHLMRYEADTENSAAAPDIALPGWVFERLSTVTGTETYRSNFGDTSLPKGNEATYSRLTTAISFTRTGATFFMKLFVGLWACVIAALLAFWIRPVNVDPRFGLGVGALFGAIASQYVIASTLPDSNVITLADKIHLWAFFFIIVSIAQSTVSLWHWEHDRQEQSKRLDVLFRWLTPLGWIASTVFMIVRA